MNRDCVAIALYFDNDPMQSSRFKYVKRNVEIIKDARVHQPMQLVNSENAKIDTRMIATVPDGTGNIFK
jgi:hypothetical protein